MRDLIDTHYSVAQSRANAARVFVRSNQAFQHAWQAYEARRSAVEPQLAAARELAKTDRAAAMSKLLAMIPDTPQTWKRQWIEPIDADYPVAVELMKLASAAKDFRMYVHGMHALVGRREIKDTREVEQMRWFAFRNGSELYNLTVGLDKPRVERVKTLQDDVNKLIAAAVNSASIAWTGTTRGDVKHCSDAGVHSGAWCWEVPMSLQVHGRTATEHVRSSYTEAYNCVDTSRFYGWDPLTGVAQYYQTCQHRQRPIKEDVEAALGEDADPKLAGSSDRAGILGHVVKSGPGSITLENAVLVDFAALNPTAGENAALVFSPPERERMDETGAVAVVKAE
ncbi:MAG TPA: hypothetical protein VMJ10_23610 [Kofleriaceae bacterium]|nr:hypothetical protein [Kofleriaceae bacterium]